MSHVDHMQRNRYELKYLIDERTAHGVKDFFRHHLVRDEHADPRFAYSYPIYSVYLDSPGLTLFHQTGQGLKNRFKLRVRYYNDSPRSPVFFEIKRRVNDVILKERAIVHRSVVPELLGGRAPLRSDMVHEEDAHGLMNLDWFFQLQQCVRAEGRVIVAYLREAWNAPDNDDVRLTFDRKVEGAWYDNELGLSRKSWAQADVGDEVILELKFTGRFPQWMNALVQEFKLRRVPLGKYICCSEALGPRGSVMSPSRRLAMTVEQAAWIGRLLQRPAGDRNAAVAAIPSGRTTVPPQVLNPAASGTFAAT